MKSESLGKGKGPKKSIILKLQLKVIVEAQLRFACEWCHADRNHIFSSVSSISSLILFF
jgi:hypothetical protein